MVDPTGLEPVTRDLRRSSSTIELRARAISAGWEVLRSHPAYSSAIGTSEIELEFSRAEGVT